MIRTNVAGVLLVVTLCGLGCSRKEQEKTPAPALRPAVEKTAVTPSPKAPAEYVGTLKCASCHEQEHQAWSGSHHDLAMQRATADTVLGNFDNQRFRYFKEAVRFSREGDDFFIEALDADGEPNRFPVVYTFGVEPLQQYLVETEPGRLQSFLVAWDTRTKQEGGQRWFHLQPDEYVGPGDPLHWTGPSYNWNHSCADCHSTDVRKNYDRATRRYSTEFFEVDVGCEACHGPGSRHVAFAEAADGQLAGDAGLERGFQAPAMRVWRFAQGAKIASLEGSASNREPEYCAPCHSRRADLGGERSSYHDRYRLAVLDELLYYDDGQIKDEVFVYGSFLQSKMHAAGVVCSDCHDGHSNELRLEGNALCARCHLATEYDAPEHVFHEPGTPGSLCTDCHMPQRTYMVNDARADHRFGTPRPAIEQAIGAPSACLGCHANESAEWAEREISKRFDDRAFEPFALALHAARAQSPEGEPALVELIAVGKAPDIVRATALLELRNLGSPALPALLMRAASDPSPVVRRTVALAARELPPEHRGEVIRPLLRDVTRTVRVEAVAAMLGVHASGWSKADRAALKSATAEYIEARSFNVDRGEGLADLAHVALLSGDARHAEENLLEALEVDPTFTAAYVNLADLYRTQQKDGEAERTLRDGLERAADRSAVEFALGLTLVRLGRHPEAMSHLRRAHRLRPEMVRYGYVYAVAQFDAGKKQSALRTLEVMRKRYPANRQVLRLLAGYSQQMGRDEQARKYSNELERLGAQP